MIPLAARVHVYVVLTDFDVHSTKVVVGSIVDYSITDGDYFVVGAVSLLLCCCCVVVVVPVVV